MTTTRSSNLAAGLRTTLLLATLTGLLVVIGFLIGGAGTALIFLFIAAAMNLGAYWFSDRIALGMSRAQPISQEEAPRIHEMVQELTTRAEMPMPRLYMIPQDQPNAFATGRSPSKAAVALTRGITRLLSEDELRGVVAHELAHIRNRDTLIQSVAATIGGAITYLGYMLLFFGRGGGNSPIQLVASLAMVLLAPLAASIIQMAISRQREYSADATGAQISGNPESLASALERLEAGAKANPMDAQRVNEATEPLYIVKPFARQGLAALFSTHPPIEERVSRLRQMRPAFV